MKTSIRTKHKKIAPLQQQQQQQLFIKTTSIHNYSEIKHLKDSLTSTQSMILIARIKPIVSMDPQAEVKLVKELYSNNAIKNNYSIFQLGEERIIVVPNTIPLSQLNLGISHYD